MPLSKSVQRQQKHHRDIDLKGYQREDGLWDIEAHLIDTKSYTFENKHRGHIAAGEAVHEMWLRLTLDDSLTVHEVEAVTDNGPFTICPDITANFQRLVGEQIKPGWTRRCRQLLGGIEGCTHLVELLGPLATVAFQTIYGGKPQKQQDSKTKPALLNSCHAFARSSDVVKEFYPEFYKAKEPASD